MYIGDTCRKGDKETPTNGSSTAKETQDQKTENLKTFVKDYQIQHTDDTEKPAKKKTGK
jgi:hypothetical protein